MSHSVFKVLDVSEDSSLNFEKITAAFIQPSVIAIACGIRKDNVINILGTGFGIKPLDGCSQTNYFVTCRHVIDEMVHIRDLGKYELGEVGLLDSDTRVAVQEIGQDRKVSWRWHILGKGALKTLSIIEMDLCIFQLQDSEIRVPSLNISENCILGAEVGVLGFPTDGNLQVGSVQPFVVKTIISSILDYKFTNISTRDDDGNDAKSDFVFPRLALGHQLAYGFSGSPVFSIHEGGAVLGVVDYTPFVEDTFYKKVKTETGHSRDETIYAQYPSFTSFAIPAKIIKSHLEKYPRYWEEANDMEKTKCEWRVRKDEGYW
jgi:hypothetical protein